MEKYIEAKKAPAATRLPNKSLTICALTAYFIMLTTSPEVVEQMEVAMKLVAISAAVAAMTALAVVDVAQTSASAGWVHNMNPNAGYTYNEGKIQRFRKSPELRQQQPKKAPVTSGQGGSK